MNKIPILSELALFDSRLLQRQREEEERARRTDVETEEERRKKEGRDWSSTENKARVKEVPSRGDR